MWSAAVVLMAVGIHLTQEFRFYNIESVNLFLYDRADIASKLLQPGGIALLLSSFMTQFMCIPYLGTVITALLYLLTGIMTFRIMSVISPIGPLMAGFSFIPAAFLFLCLENDYYMYHGHVAFILALAAILAYACFPQEKPLIRAVAGLIIVPLLYQASGSAAIVFAVSALVLDIARYGFRGLPALIYPAILLLTAWIYVRMSLADGWESALTPFMYYSNPSTYFFPLYAWASVPLLMLVSIGLRRLNLKSKASVAVSAAGLACSFIIAWNIY